MDYRKFRYQNCVEMPSGNNRINGVMKGGNTYKNSVIISLAINFRLVIKRKQNFKYVYVA